MSTDDLIERIARALSEHWRDMHTNESLGKQRMLAAAVLPIMEAEVRAAKADAWDEAYRCGVDDARLADDLRVDVGLGPDLYAQPARQNPYRATETGGRA